MTVRNPCNPCKKTLFSIIQKSLLAAIHYSGSPFTKNQSSLTQLLADIPVLSIHFNQPFPMRPVGELVHCCSFCIISPSLIYPRISLLQKKKI